MVFDYSRLRGRIIERFGSQREFANHLGVSEQTITSKMTSKTFLGQDDIIAWSEALDIEANDIGSFFFAKKLS